MRIKRVLNIFGVGILIIGVVFIFNSFSSVTGFVIIENISTTLGSYLGLFFIIMGILLLTAGKLSNRYLVGRLVGEYEAGQLNPVEVALRINEVLEGARINGVNYHGGIDQTLRTDKEFIPIRLRDQEKARDLALALYEIALINDRRNARNCKLHISKRASSKHHKKGLRELIGEFEEKYNKDLKSARTA